MIEFLTSVVAVAVVLGIMIVLHEWGHFIGAKFFGVRVEVFSIGMGPRLWGWRRGDTDYRVSALPIGGYVRMAGENPSEERAGAPDEFLSKPRWQRVLIAVAGPTMNLVAAVVLIAALFMVGMPLPTYIDSPVEVAGVLKDSPAERAGIEPGDRVVELNGIQDPTWERVRFELLLTSPDTPVSVVLDRKGERIPLALHTVAVRSPQDEFSLLGYPHEPVLIGGVLRGMPADVAGLKPDDEILAVNGRPVTSPFQFAARIQELGGSIIRLEVRREDEALHIDVRPSFRDPGDGNRRWQIGIGFRTATVHKSYGVSGAIQRSFWFNIRLTQQIIQVVIQLFSGETSLRQLEGPVGIARQSGQAARRGPIEFINLMAVISLNLGIINLLPIPILDGGHVLLLAIEGLLRRDLSVAIKERFVQVGMVFLLVVFAIVMYNDILKTLPGR